MAQLIVRNLEDDVKKKLVLRARKHGNSMEEEVRDILRNAVKSELAKESPMGFGSHFASYFKGIGLTEPLPELRGHRPKPADFDQSEP